MKKAFSDPFSEKQLREKLSRLGQEHLLQGWKSLSSLEQNQFMHQVEHLDEQLIARQIEVIHRPEEAALSFDPFDTYGVHHSPGIVQRGQETMASGKCACLLVAGGQGSRLRFEGPKGCVPVSVIKKKTLFQLAAEKVKAASHQVGRPLEWALMTSPLNHVETETYFIQQSFFGLPPTHVHFFYQDVWPLLDLEGRLFFENPGCLALGPNGNGGALRRLVETGLLDRWKKLGIEMISFIPIDNPLADPFDAGLFGFHEIQQNEVTIKAALRQDPQEKVGILVKKEGKVHVIEYSEFPASAKEARGPQGMLFPLANLSLFCFSLSFIEKIFDYPLPLHRAKKAVKKLANARDSILPEEPNAWKFEEFIFDVLPCAERVGAIVYPREECFAPLKNFKGTDSIPTVQAALQAADRKAFFRVSGIEPPTTAIFELSQDFYYPTEALLKKWRGRQLPLEPYINPHTIEKGLI